MDADVSVAASKWKLNKPFAGQTDLDIAPCFQLVQSLRFGGIFIIERGPNWKVFGDLAEQSLVLSTIYQEYSEWHRNAAVRLRAISHGASESDWAEIASSELPAMNKSLGGRAKIRLHRMARQQ